MGDDPDGKLFAKFRYLLVKRLRREVGGLLLAEALRKVETKVADEAA